MNRRTTQMRTDFTAITEAIDNLIAILSEASTKLIQTANEQRVEMLTLRQRMTDTANDIEELGTILDDASEEIAAISGICYDVSDKIIAGLADSDEIPSCNYEDFVAICDECGADITVDSDYEIDDNGHTLCAECSALYKGNTDGEQTTMDIPETVTAQ
jgi:hypothetical protein